MAIDFPSNPSDGQTKTYNGKTWTYDSSTTSWAFTPSTFTETDPVVGAINGLIKADGNGNITNAVAGTDYLSSTSLYTNSDVDTHLNQTNPTAGHVLSWDGSNYAWVAQSGGGTSYADSDVDTHLNQTGSITDGYVLSWDAAANGGIGDYAWVAQSSGGGSSLWSENGSELYRNSYVGIGDFSSTAPTSTLHVKAVSNNPALNCGNNNTSTGSYSTAIGRDCESTSVYSISMGWTAKSWSKYSIAIGNLNTSTSTSSAFADLGKYSIAIGNGAVTKGLKSLAFGNDVTSGGIYSISMGTNITTTSSYSFGIGLSGDTSTLSQPSTMAIMGGKVAIDTSKNTDGILDDITEKLEVGGAIKIGTTSTASPSGGEIKYDSNDFFGHDGTAWKSLTSGGGGGGTLSSRTTFNTNTDMTTTDSKTLTVGASASGHITGFKSYSLLKINISQPDLWVTIYTDPTSMSNDASRLYTQDPNPSSGVIAEFITDSNNSGQDIIITPTVIGFNAESTPADKIYLKVSNIGSSNQTSDFIIQMTVLQLEA